MDKDSDINSTHISSQRKSGHRDIYGVIGVCGVVGNLVARVLIDHGLKVTGTDSKSEGDCKFGYTLKDYHLPLYLGEHPESFFIESTYIIPPPSLSKNSNLSKKINKRVKLSLFISGHRYK